MSRHAEKRRRRKRKRKKREIEITADVSAVDNARPERIRTHARKGDTPTFFLLLYYCGRVRCGRKTGTVAKR